MIASLTDPPDVDGDWSQQKRVLASIPGGPIGVYGNAILDDIEKALAGLDLPLTDMDPDVESTSSAFGLYGNEYERWALVSRQKIGEQQIYRQAFALLREIKANCDLNEPSSVLEFVAELPDRKLLVPLIGERLIVKCESNRIRIYSPGKNRYDDNLQAGSDDVGLESIVRLCRRFRFKPAPILATAFGGGRGTNDRSCQRCDPYLSAWWFGATRIL